MPKNYKDKAYYESLYNDILRTLMIHDKAHNTSVSKYIYNVIKYNDNRLLRPINGTNNLIFDINEGIFDGHPFLVMVSTPNTNNITLKIGNRDPIPLYDKNGSEIAPGNFNDRYIYPIRYDSTNNVFKLLDMDNETIATSQSAGGVSELLLRNKIIDTNTITDEEFETRLNEVLDNIFTPYIIPDIMAKYIEEYNKD